MHATLLYSFTWLYTWLVYVQRQVYFDPYPVISYICYMPYTDSKAPDQPTHPHSLPLQFHSPLIIQQDRILKILVSVALRSDFADAHINLELHYPLSIYDQAWSVFKR